MTERLPLKELFRLHSSRLAIAREVGALIHEHRDKFAATAESYAALVGQLSVTDQEIEFNLLGQQLAEEVIVNITDGE